MIIFENIENAFFVFFKNCSYSLNLMFCVYFVFLKIKFKKENKKTIGTKHFLCVFFVLLVF